ncbi:shikimate kinase [Fodinibius salsisoli]|uniref:Shikimate kinase n=1 Tax=Fodinibius salsisoli TaxID=2820877 RepID=A0ABT3PL31_9BACT|nr:shikimate kinase [Fodinibius salsisoli]MCW9706656.1 shikimate kinase [Fodinibius salsisoli]
MNVPEIIFLCGFMGTGKTTIGRKLAQKLDYPFLDLDDRIVERAGQSIPDIFEAGGEGRFRTVERKALMEVCRSFKGVVALGGGSLQNQHLLDHLKLNGLLIFIETPFSVLIDRIYQDKNRPLLLDESGNVKERKTLEEELRFLYDDRLPLYRQASISIQMSRGESPEEQVETLFKKIRNHVA